MIGENENYEGQMVISGAPVVLELLGSEKEGMIFTPDDRMSAQRALQILQNDSGLEMASPNEQDLVNAVSQRLACLVLGQEEDFDPHSALYFMREMNTFNPSVHNEYRQPLNERADEIERCYSNSTVAKDIRSAVSTDLESTGRL